MGWTNCGFNCQVNIDCCDIYTTAVRRGFIPERTGPGWNTKNKQTNKKLPIVDRKTKHRAAVWRSAPIRKNRIQWM
jgi:hypothetical protein